MLRRNGSGRLSSNTRVSQLEDINPMATVANLVDAMLVLAVGIMLALIVSWNLNIMENGHVNDNARKEDALSDFTEKDIQNAETKTEQLEKQGSVYYDPETDKYYIIANDGTQMTVEN
ncbi:MAG: DUF2149 domain-containing protein [Clostridiales bacterium]|nr:DUF2149 domain-containing protein [Candidatus Crickella caballi]